MNSKRAKGRPKRQDGDPGRDRLISAAREMIRGGSGVDLVGKDLALAAGVTPALVKYYFQDKASLVEAVARPIIDDYLVRLTQTLREKSTTLARFRSLVALLLLISNENGFLLDSYVLYVKHNPSPHLSANFLEMSFREVSQFLQECEAEGLFRSSNRAVTATVIWGTCRTVGQLAELRAVLFPEPVSTAELVQRQADLVVDILLNGLLCRENQSHPAKRRADKHLVPLPLPDAR